MKNLVLLFIAAISFTITSCNSQQFSGYVPEDTTPDITVVDELSRSPETKVTIKVISDNGDTIIAKILYRLAPEILTFKGRHPLSLNKKVYVEYTISDNEAVIVSAGLNQRKQ
jgi:hypothetical protein